MANQPHPSKQAVTWRLPRTLLDRVKTAADERGETVLALVTRALERELDSPDTVQAPDVAALDDDHAVQVAAERLRAAAAALPRIDITDHDRTVLRWLASYMQGPPSSRSVAVARALLGTDTTPGDRP